MLCWSMKVAFTEILFVREATPSYLDLGSQTEAADQQCIGKIDASMCRGQSTS